MSLNVAGIGPAGIDPQVAALAPSQLAERLCERGEPGLPLGIVRGDIREHADAPRAFELLRPRRERPRRCAAECGQQFPPSDGDYHTPLPCEVRKWNDSTPRARSLHVQAGQDVVASTS